MNGVPRTVIVSGASPMLPPHGQRGVALVLVLWFVVALTLLATSALSVMRVDVRASTQLQAQVKAVALADAAIQWALLEIDTQPELLHHQALYRDYMVADTLVRVAIHPDNGMINIRLASAELLALLFTVRGGLERAEAEGLAEAVVAWRAAGTNPRQQREGYPRGENFSYPEDLLQVRGMTASVYQKVSNALTVHGGYHLINPAMAPLPVLEVLTRGDAARALEIKQAFMAGHAGVSLDDLPQDMVLPGGTGSNLRATAQLEVDGQHWERQRWVRRRGGSDREPWQTLDLDMYVPQDY